MRKTAQFRTESILIYSDRWISGTNTIELTIKTICVLKRPFKHVFKIIALKGDYLAVKIPTMKYLWITLLFCCNAFLGFPQISITGRVVDETQKPIEFSNVLLLDVADTSLIKGTITSATGNFSFNNVYPGSYLLSASNLGYATVYTEPIELKEQGLVEPILLILSQSPEMLDEAIIVAEKPLFEQKIDRTIVNVQNSITAVGSTALEVLERSPGVDVDRANNQIAMQGKQGVVVMLNGKQLRMEAASVVQLLSTMSAGNIQKIELISTPPASFDAEGDAGVINIETIKKEDEGINGSLSLHTGYGQRGKYGGAFHFALRKNKISLFTDLSGDWNYSQEDVQLARKNVFGNQITTLDIFSDRPAYTGLFSGRIGLDYEISRQSVVGVLFSSYLSEWTLDAFTRTAIRDNIEGNTRSELESDEINNWTHWMTNINFRHTFPNEARLSFDLDYLNYIDNNPTDYKDKTFDSKGQLIEEETFISRKKTPIDFKVAKFDFSKPLQEGLSFEVGLKGTLSTFTNKVSVSHLQNDIWVFDPRFTDNFHLDEKIGAAYFSIDYQLSKQISTKAGLRYEYINSVLGSMNEGDLVVQNYGRIFPNLHLAYQFDENSELQFSYNERISRPPMTTLAPAFFFWGPNTILAGNPAVRPTISRQLSTAFRFKAVLLRLQYTDYNDPITTQPTVDAEANLLFTRAENMVDLKRGVLSLNFTIQITSWWESRYNMAAYLQKIQPIFEESIIERSDFFFTANTNQNFKLPADFGVELSASFRSALKRGLGTMPYRGSINLGLQKSLGQHHQLTLNWSDLFDLGSFFRIQYDQPALNIFYDWHYEVEGSVFRLSYRYNFGNKGLQKVGKRNTGSEEERGRVN